MSLRQAPEFRIVMAQARLAGLAIVHDCEADQCARAGRASLDLQGHAGQAGHREIKCFGPLTQAGEGVRKLVAGLGDCDIAQVSTGHALSAAILETVGYEGGNTHSGTTAEEAITGGTGVCQDHAHIFCSAARLLGLPARYVSGYLMMNDRVEQDASHAWAEAYFEGLGWVGFDVSNGYSPDERYIRVATGIDFREAAPINGMRMGGSDEGVLVTLKVEQ